eukprot:scaffold2448_cov155-Amphora_coffeaeformis.AAC.16
MNQAFEDGACLRGATLRRAAFGFAVVSSAYTIQPSAPPEAELYYGTAEEAFNSEVPVASAVPIASDDNPDESLAHEAATPLVESQHGFANATATETNYVSGLKLDPKRIRCPFCSEEAVTNTHNVVDLFTIIAV